MPLDSSLTNPVNLGQVPSGFAGSGAPTDQWLRRIALVVYNSGGKALNFTPANVGQYGELIHIRCRFEVTRTTVQTPNMLVARIYNLNMTNNQGGRTAPNSDRQYSLREFNRVTLAAGYQTGAFGQLFDGTIVLFKQGKETPVDSYLDIIAGDGDRPMDYTPVAKTFPAGTPRKEIFAHCAQQMGQYGAEVGDINLGKGGDIRSLRGTAVFGMARDTMRDIANACTADWSIQDGKVTVLPRDAVLPGEAVVLSPATGLVGMPEVTEQGIVARCLLNPKLRLGTKVQIDSGLLSGVPYTPGDTSSPAVPAGGQVVSPAARGQVFSFAPTSPTGTYKIFLLKHVGDTRDNPWYSEIVCLALDAGGKVIPFVTSAQTRGGFESESQAATFGGTGNPPP